VFRLGTFTGGSFSGGPKRPQAAAGPLTSCPPGAWRQSREGRRRSWHRVHPHGPRNGCQPDVRRRLQLLQYVPTGPHRSAERRSAHLNFGRSVRSAHNKVPGVSRSQPGRSREQYEMSTDGRFLRRHARRQRIGSPEDLIMSRSVVASCSPWLPFDAEINGCLERGARKNAGIPCRRT
jgi:hypothetical protein